MHFFNIVPLCFICEPKLWLLFVIDFYIRIISHSGLVNKKKNCVRKSAVCYECMSRGGAVRPSKMYSFVL